MKLLGISQRVDSVASYNERRDCLDQRWWQFGEKLGSILLPLPNISPDHVNELAASLSLEGIILSGGNTISTDGTLVADSAPERDVFERALITWALKNNVPILGVCRGAQMLKPLF